MKILHVNSSDTYGGAARAAYRLHYSLRNTGIDSCMMVQEKATTDDAVIGPGGLVTKSLARVRPYAEAYAFRYLGSGAKIVFSPSWLGMPGVSRGIATQNPDIVHLHWISGGMLRAVDLPAIRQPIVWTLHDMWPFTGGCHYTGGCQRYMQQCGNCPHLNRSGEHDTSRKLHRRKQEGWASLRMTIVTPSRWMAERARESSLFAGRRIEIIANGLDLGRFSPGDQMLARASLDLPQDKDLLLFGAINATSDQRKGFDLLFTALQKLDIKYRENTQLVVFGSAKQRKLVEFGLPVHYMGKIHEDERLATIYRAVDAMVVPSREDNLPNTAVEAIACGTPVVGFDIGGMPDIVNHQQNGYLAAAEDTAELAKGIEWMLADKTRRDRLAEQARVKARDCFDEAATAAQYRSLYQSLLLL